MDDAKSLNRRFETIAWGTFFIVWGLTSLFRFLPDGSATIGIGVILLGLNLARYLNRISTSGFTITLGVIALVIGAVDVARAVFRLPIDLPFFPILLITIGVIWIAREVTKR
ncbi:MAG: hypothetical protein HY868_15010 [Chloroflexi bacterium]|nr:hypothetical protein [Chloroflexota bacterium]